MDVVVTYHGTPGAAGSFGFDTANGRQLIWSLCEPFGARTWWPCKDSPEDKADSVDVRVTVPTGHDHRVATARCVEATDNGTTAVTRWHERYPITTYLVSLASYPYTVTPTGTAPRPTDSMEIQFYNFPESVAGAAAVQAKVKDMIAAYAGCFGEYPFLDEKYGHAEFPWGGGMEHQTCTSLGVVQRVRRRARAGAPVVGRHGHLPRLPPHLAERGLRHLLRGALGRGATAARPPTTRTSTSTSTSARARSTCPT